MTATENKYNWFIFEILPQPSYTLLMGIWRQTKLFHFTFPSNWIQIQNIIPELKKIALLLCVAWKPWDIDNGGFRGVGRTRRAPLPYGPNFFNFIGFFSENIIKILSRLPPQDWRPHLGKVQDPPLYNCFPLFFYRRVWNKNLTLWRDEIII